MTKYIHVILFILLFSTLSFAADDVRKISVTGKSSITLDAQTSTINFYVKSIDETMSSSYKKISTLLDKIIGDLVSSGISPDDITKSLIDQGADYSWEKNTRILKGYYSSCRVSFVVDDLSTLPTMYEVLSQYEDINISGAEYKRNDEFEVRQKEFEKALKAAKEKAQHMVTFMDAKLGKVKEIQEVSSDNFVSRSVYSNTMKSEQAIPVSIGSVTITATVYVEFFIE